MLRETFEAEVFEEVVPASTRRFAKTRKSHLDDILTAVHAETPSFEAWSTHLVGVADSVFVGNRGVVLGLFDTRGAEPRAMSIATSAPQGCAPRLPDLLTYKNDVLRIVGHPTEHAISAFIVQFDQPRPSSPYERMLAATIGLHLEASVRRRLLPECVGRTLDVNDVEPSVKEADLWSALTCGQAALVPATAGQYHIIAGTPEWQARRALSPREQAILELATRGASGKVLSHTLRISGPTVSRALGTAAAKIGVRTSIELIQLASRLRLGEPLSLVEERLTAAEHDVLALLRKGMSNAEIARARGSSIRTVANHVASLLRKTNSASRRALIVSAPTTPPPG